MNRRWQTLDEAIDTSQQDQERDNTPPLEELPVHIKVLVDPDHRRTCGIRFQRCGGGRRIIRKNYGGY